ncbi:MAG: peptide ABC transporter substrate-binding protein [Alphaproteobacteria bacterium]|nr:peptide ABC transporter substrate-binding protein [Alphaproteobacteria bacterium]
MEVRITLKANLFWGDGQPVTTKDAEFAFRLRAQWNAGVQASAYATIESVRSVDDHTFILMLDKVRFGHEAWLMKAYLLPHHIEAPLLAKASNRTEYENSLSTYITSPTTAGLWNGPFIVSEINPGISITLKQNPYWRGEKSSFKTIILKYIKPERYAESLVSGEFDYGPGELGLSAADGLKLIKSKRDVIDLHFQQSTRIFFLLPNHTNEILKRLPISKALMPALDREDIANKHLGDRQAVADTMIAPGMPGYDPAVYRYPYDPEAAIALFEQEGFKLGPDGIRSNADGQRLSFDMFVTFAAAPVAEMVKQQWRQVGVDILVRPSEVKVMFETFRSGNFSLIMYNHVISPGVVPAWFLSKESIYSSETANSLWKYNYSRYSNAEMEVLTLAIEQETNQDRRITIWKRFQQLYANELPAFPIMWNVECYAIPTWLTGIDPTGHIVPSSYTAELWRADR